MRKCYTCKTPSFDGVQNVFLYNFILFLFLIMAGVIAIVMGRCVLPNFCCGTCCVTTLFCVVDVNPLEDLNPYCLADVIANVADGKPLG